MIACKQGENLKNTSQKHIQRHVLAKARNCFYLNQHFVLIMDKPVPKEKKVILAVKWRHKYLVYIKMPKRLCKFTVCGESKSPQIPHRFAEFNSTSYKFLTIIRTDFRWCAHVQKIAKRNWIIIGEISQHVFASLPLNAKKVLKIPCKIKF